MDVQSEKASLGKRSPLKRLPQEKTASREIFPRDITGSDIFKNKIQNKLTLDHGKFKKLKVQFNGQLNTDLELEGGSKKLSSAVVKTRVSSAL